MALFKLNFQKKNILHRLVSIAFCLLVVIFLSTPLYAESNTPNVGDIADYGVWATENNKQLVINNIYSDIDTFIHNR